MAIKVIPPCHSVRVLGRGAHGQKQFVTVREDMIYSARASSQQMVAEIKFVKQGRLNGAATTQGGRQVRGNVKSESGVWRLKKLRPNLLD